VDSTYYEEMAGCLRGLLIRMSDRFSDKDMRLIAEFIDGNELGLALEQIADVLSEDQQPVSQDERADMLALAERMQMNDRVSRALAFCPDRG
jgi:DNA-binding transcriptional MerR regulator